MSRAFDLFDSPLHIIAVGADLFADALDAHGVPVTRVAWQPSAGNSDAALRWHGFRHSREWIRQPLVRGSGATSQGALF